MAQCSEENLLYSYDSFGNIGGMSEQYNAGATSTYSFCYDAQNRLVAQSEPGSVEQL